MRKSIEKAHKVSQIITFNKRTNKTTDFMQVVGTANRFNSNYYASLKYNVPQSNNQSWIGLFRQKKNKPSAL